MDTWVHDGTQFRKAKKIWVHDGTTNRLVQKVWVHDGTSFKQVFQNFALGFSTGLTVSEAEPDPYVVYAGIYVQTDGSIHRRSYRDSELLINDTSKHWGQPLAAGIGTSHHVRCRWVGGATEPLGYGLNTWYQITMEIYWFMIKVGYGDATAAIVLDVSDNGGSTYVSSETFSLESSVF